MDHMISIQMLKSLQEVSAVGLIMNKTSDTPTALQIKVCKVKLIRPFILVYTSNY